MKTVKGLEITDSPVPSPKSMPYPNRLLSLCTQLQFIPRSKNA